MTPRARRLLDRQFIISCRRVSVVLLACNNQPDRRVRCRMRHLGLPVAFDCGQARGNAPAASSRQYNYGNRNAISCKKKRKKNEEEEKEMKGERKEAASGGRRTRPGQTSLFPTIFPQRTRRDGRRAGCNGAER
ncbi:hypothetical protein PUN28_016159 [Cardiocondyla obscurior]|uniref:Uncharacterized protein n=1 Tax=Cardiocondyla obscurior TaxID=286306 RepID=A0AAW2ETR5_9HYME